MPGEQKPASVLPQQRPKRGAKGRRGKSSTAASHEPQPSPPPTAGLLLLGAILWRGGGLSDRPAIYCGSPGKSAWCRYPWWCSVFLSHAHKQHAHRHTHSFHFHLQAKKDPERISEDTSQKLPWKKCFCLHLVTSSLWCVCGQDMHQLSRVK